MNKKIAIYFSDEEKYGYPFWQKRYLEPYKDIIKRIEKEDIEVYIVRWKSYIWEWKFNKAYRFDEKWELNDFEEIKVDLIFNRDDKNTIPYITDCKIINHPEFDQICLDKIKTFNKFPELSPKTAYIHSYEEYLQKVEDFSFSETNMVVLKKNFESSWRGIFIWKISEITKNIYENWENILFQEYIDTSVWIKGIVEWKHDIRITVVNWKIISSNIRQPKDWSFLANSSAGGTWFSIEIEDIPKELIEKTREIEENFREYYPMVFSADFMNSKDWFKLVELNSRPWVQHISKVKKYYIYNNALADLLIETVKKI